MKIAETVTFGGSGLDRAAHLRNDADGLHKAWRDAGARILPMWRGKPLYRGDDLAFLASDDPLVAKLESKATLLGLDGGSPCFAVDLSEWEPEEVPASMNSFLDPSEQHHPDLPDDHVFKELRRMMALMSPREAEIAATAKAILGWHATHGFCARCGQPSKLSMAGWQSTCTACGAHHFPRTDPVVIMLITHGNSVLMGRSHGWPEGMYSLLAGFVEPGETIEAAVRREVFEEAGVRVGRVDYMASQPWPFPASLMFGCAGRATSTDITIDPAEIEDARWVTREQMMDVFAGLSEAMLPARKGAIAHFLLTNWLADRLD